ncbi:MAG TPA: zinc-binding alcohol dehydrogenase family protein [Tepidisphaeraceae bacterium]|jgi:NADPH2:quinone reductase|nr:zinc-binding alcohol dehydrogenase family protein [Tepidisphaeraceae bacterium]
MKAWLLDDMGGVGGLKLREAPDPIPAAGEVVLQVAYAALNPADRYLSEGHYPARPPMPHILGRDGFGTIVAVGADVTGVHVGEKKTVLRGDVGVTRWGTFAEKVAVPVESLIDAPADWSEQEAAGAALVYVTAYQALTQWGELPPSIVLVSGASGGVGVASVQLAGALGHTPLALSRGTAKHAQLKQIGAAAVFDPTDPAWRKKVKEFLDGRRVDLAIDNIGGPLFSEMIDTLGEWGKVSVVGRLAGPVPEFNTSALLFRRLRIGGVAVGAYTNAESRAAWSAIISLLQGAGAKPLIDRVFPFDQLPAAFARLAQGPMGKVLIAAG